MEVLIPLLPTVLLALFAGLACWYNLWRVDQFLKTSKQNRSPD
jgi:hypothetical protein